MLRLHLWYTSRRMRDARRDGEGVLVAQEGITYEGGKGESLEEAIRVLGAPDHMAGVEAEYAYLEQAFGRPGADWTLEMQVFHFMDEHPYDELRIRLADGTRKSCYFDLADFFGKF